MRKLIVKTLAIVTIPICYIGKVIFLIADFAQDFLSDVIDESVKTERAITEFFTKKKP